MNAVDEGPMDNELARDLAPIADTKVAPAVGIAAIALNMALKYHDTNMVKEGALYQQYKLEGKNLRPYTTDVVIETAKEFELFLLGASDRIAKIIVDAVIEGVKDDPEEQLEVQS